MAEIHETPWLQLRRRDENLRGYSDHDRDVMLECAQSLAAAHGIHPDVALNHLLSVIWRWERNAAKQVK